MMSVCLALTVEATIAQIPLTLTWIAVTSIVLTIGLVMFFVMMQTITKNVTGMVETVVENMLLTVTVNIVNVVTPRMNKLGQIVYIKYFCVKISCKLIS